MKNKTIFFFTVTLLVLILGITAISAADTNTTDTPTTHIEQTTQHVTQDTQTIDTNNKQLKADVKNTSTKKVTNTEKKTIKQKTTTKTTKKDSETVDVYVSDSTGSDDTTDSKTTPYKTINKALSSVTSNTTVYNIHIAEGTYKGVGNTNLTVNGGSNINFIGDGVNKTVFDGEAGYDVQTRGYYWGSSPIWFYFVNGTGNWFMNITQGTGKITITNMTMQNAWVKGGSSINAYKLAPIDNHATLSVENVYFYHNLCGVGAAVRNRETGDLTVNNCTFDNNMKSDSTGNFGAIYNNGTAYLNNSLFVNNYARWGTVTNDKYLYVNNCTFKNGTGYDGASTFKYGSGIASNTGSADYFNPYSGLTGIITEITNSTFISNDQSDIWQDKGHLLVDGCTFINGTGIYVSGSRANMTLVQNITNNNFVNMQPTTLYTSLSSTTKPTYAINSVARGYNLTIANNNISIDVTPYSTGILLAGYGRIINNTLNDYISITGTDVTVENNTIRTDKSYAVTATKTNNTIVNNTLYSSILYGDLAVNANTTTNTVKDNQPVTLALVITDDNYNNYFNANGTVKNGTIPDGSKILLSGDLYNKDFVFDNNKLYLANNDTAVLHNSTIKTINNAQVVIDGIVINNVNSTKTSAIVLNTTKNQVTNTKINVKTTNKIHAIELLADENSIQRTSIVVDGPSNNVTYTSIGIADTIGILISSNDNTINQVNVTVTGTNGETYGTVDGIDIQSINAGEIVTGNTLTNTRIYVTGDVYAYGLNIQRAEDTTTSMLWSNVESDFYASALQLSGPSSNNNIAGYLNATAGSIAYGAYITGQWSGVVSNNSFSKLYIQNVKAPTSTGIELEKVSNITLSDATYTLNGDNNTAVKVTNSDNITVNKITLNSKAKDVNSSMADVFNSTNIVITDNTFNTFTGNGVVVTSSGNINVSKNYLNIGNLTGGNSAVTQTGNTNITVANNTPTIAVLTMDTYNQYFDENSTLRLNNNTYSFMTLGGDLYNKDLIIDMDSYLANSNQFELRNAANYTIYNGTIKFTGTRANTRATFNGININNTDKAAITTDLNNTYQVDIRYNNGNITVSGDNITAIVSERNANVTGYNYMSFDNDNFIITGKNATLVRYSGIKTKNSWSSVYFNNGVIEIKNSDINITAEDTSIVVDAKTSNIYFNHNNVMQNAKNVVTIQGNDADLYYNNGFQYNNVTVNGDTAAVLNVTKTYYSSSIWYNNIKINSKTPVIVFNLTGDGNDIQHNVIILNTTNGEVPVINVPKETNRYSRSYVRNNYIEALDVTGNNAVNNTGVTIQNNTPYNNTGYMDILNITVPENNTINRNTQITATVTDVFGNPINGTFTVTINGNETIIQNTSNITVNYTPKTSGLHTITVAFNDTTGKYNLNTTTTTINVPKLNTTVQIANITTVLDDVTTFTATITDSNGENVTSGQVTFSVNGTPLTDANGNIIYADVTGGIATLNYTAQYSWLNANNTSVNYIGNDVYESSTSTGNIVVDRKTVNMKLEVLNHNIKPGDTAIIMVTVTDKYGNMVKSGKVIFKLNGKTLKDSNGSTITVRIYNGIAIFKYVVPVNYSAKTYNLTAVSVGNTYNRVETTTNLTLTKINTYIQNDKTQFENQTLHVRASIYSTSTFNKVSYRETKVTVKINGKTFINKAKVNNGTIDLSIDASNMGAATYNITIIAGENGIYKTSSTVFNIYKALPRVKTTQNLNQTSSNTTRLTA